MVSDCAVGDPLFESGPLTTFSRCHHLFSLASFNRGSRGSGGGARLFFALEFMSQSLLPPFAG